MNDIKFEKHCKRCKRGKPCKRRHVYAMELDSQISTKKWFLEMNPNYKEGKPCVYVGKTIHHPLCRKSMHMNCRGENWKEKSWECICSKKYGINSCKYGNRTSKKRVSDFMTGYLKPRLYKYINPQKGANKNSNAELDLAIDLRSLGFGVYTDAKHEEE